MSIAEQFRLEGVQQGMQQGVQQGQLQGRQQIAHKMLVNGFDNKSIVELTGLSPVELEALMD